MIAFTDQLEQRLRQVWQTRRRVIGGAGAAWTVAVLAGLFVIGFAIDRLAKLPPLGRWVMLLLWLGAAAVVAYRQWWRHRRSFHAMQLALEAEKTDPQLDGLLVSSLQLSNDHSSPQLIEALRHQAAERGSHADFSRLIDRSPLRPAGAWLGGAVLMMGLLIAWQGSVVGIFAQRLLTPWRDVEYVTRTVIAVATPSQTVRQGTPMEIAADVSGEIPRSGQLWLRFGDGDWERIDVSGSGPRFALKLPRVRESFDYEFAIGDAVSRRRRITAVRPPGIASGILRLDFPAYTGLKPQTISTFNVKAPQGTRITWQLKMDRPVQQIELLSQDQPPVTMSLGDNGASATVSAAASASAGYVIRTHWVLDQTPYTDDSPTHYIQVVPDAEPLATLLAPTEDTKATVGKTVHLRFAAQDDYALDQATLIYTFNGSSERRLKLANLAGRLNVESTYDWVIKETISDIKPGDLVSFAVEITDRGDGHSQAARTPSRRVQIVSDADYLVYVSQQQRRLLSQLRPLYQHQIEATKVTPTTLRSQP